MSKCTQVCVSVHICAHTIHLSLSLSLWHMHAHTYTHTNKNMKADESQRSINGKLLIAATMFSFLFDSFGYCWVQSSEINQRLVLSPWMCASMVPFNLQLWTLWLSSVLIPGSTKNKCLPYWHAGSFSNCFKKKKKKPSRVFSAAEVCVTFIDLILLLITRVLHL